MLFRCCSLQSRVYLKFSRLSPYTRHLLKPEHVPFAQPFRQGQVKKSTEKTSGSQAKDTSTNRLFISKTDQVRICCVSTVGQVFVLFKDRLTRYSFAEADVSCASCLSSSCIAIISSICHSMRRKSTSEGALPRLTLYEKSAYRDGLAHLRDDHLRSVSTNP